MTQQIEPITIFNSENKGVFLRVHRPLLRDDISKAEILDAYGNTLFTSILTAKTIEEVAQQLNLTLKTDNTKQFLTEIMEADAKDGLYEQEAEYWQRTTLLRWSKRNNLFGPKTPVLQQVWQSNTGKQEWRDVPEED